MNTSTSLAIGKALLSLSEKEKSAVMALSGLFGSFAAQKLDAPAVVGAIRNREPGVLPEYVHRVAGFAQKAAAAEPAWHVVLDGLRSALTRASVDEKALVGAIPKLANLLDLDLAIDGSLDNDLRSLVLSLGNRIHEIPQERGVNAMTQCPNCEWTYAVSV